MPKQLTDAQERPLSELFAAVIEWAISQGAENLKEHPGLWTGKTDTYEVKLNGHMDTIDNVPPMTAVVSMPNGFLPCAIVSPFEGMILGSSEPGENEDGLIAHFKRAALEAGEGVRS